MGPQEQGSEISGMWTVISAEREGNLVSQFVNARFVLRDDVFGMQSGERRIGEGKCRLDPGKNPKEIDLTDSRGTRLGIYKLEGDQLTLCLGEPNRVSRPAEFTARVGSLQMLLILRRELL